MVFLTISFITSIPFSLPYKLMIFSMLDVQARPTYFVLLLDSPVLKLRSILETCFTIESFKFSFSTSFLSSSLLLSIFLPLSGSVSIFSFLGSLSTLSDAKLLTRSKTPSISTYVIAFPRSI